MKNSFYLLFLAAFLSSTPMVGQIRVDQIGDKLGLKDDQDDYTADVQKAMQAFSTFDLTGLDVNWTTILSEEVEVMSNALKSYEDDFLNAEVIVLDQNLEGYGTPQAQGQLTFKSTDGKVKKLNIIYGFSGTGGSLEINSVIIIHGETIEYRFPQLYDQARIYLDNINIVDKQDDNLKKIAVYEEALSFFEDNFSRLKSYLNKPNQTISNFYGSLAWFYNLANQGDKAIVASQKGLTYHPANEWINTNLALGYVLNNQFEKARPIYIKHVNTSFRGGTLGSIFKQDLNDLEAVGISIPNVKEVRSLLKK